MMAVGDLVHVDGVLLEITWDGAIDHAARPVTAVPPAREAQPQLARKLVIDTIQTYGPVTQREISALTGLVSDVVYAHIYRLRKSGAVASRDSGTILNSRWPEQVYWWSGGNHTI